MSQFLFYRSINCKDMSEADFAPGLPKRASGCQLFSLLEDDVFERLAWWVSFLSIHAPALNWPFRISSVLNIQKTKTKTSGPINSRQIDGETMETATDFIFLESKITADGDSSHEIKRCLLLGRKAMTKLDSMLKSRDITLLKKVHLVKAMVFSVVVYGCESWTIKKAEHWKIDAFELWC